MKNYSMITKDAYPANKTKLWSCLCKVALCQECTTAKLDNSWIFRYLTMVEPVRFNLTGDAIKGQTGSWKWEHGIKKLVKLMVVEDIELAKMEKVLVDVGYVHAWQQQLGPKLILKGLDVGEEREKNHWYF